MLKSSMRKKFNRVLAGVLSVPIVTTMVPDIWLPVNAENVRNEILNTELYPSNTFVDADVSEKEDQNTNSNNPQTSYDYYGVESGDDDETEPIPAETTFPIPKPEISQIHVGDLLLYSEEDFQKYAYKNNTYSIIDLEMSWTEDEEYCKGLDGHLVTISDADEQNFINTTLISAGIKNIYLIGSSKNSSSDS